MIQQIFKPYYISELDTFKGHLSLQKVVFGVDSNIFDNDSKIFNLNIIIMTSQLSIKCYCNNINELGHGVH